MNLELRSPLLWRGSLVNHLTRKSLDWCVPHRGCLPASGRAAVQAPSALVGADNGWTLSRTCFKSSCDLGWNQCLSWWKWKSLSCVWLCDPLYSPWNSPGQNTGAGNLSLLQRDLPNPGMEPRSPTLQADSLPAEPQGSPRILMWVAYPFSRGWIFLTQELNQGLLHCTWILYQLSYQGSSTWLKIKSSSILLSTVILSIYISSAPWVFSFLRVFSTIHLCRLRMASQTGAVFPRCGFDLHISNNSWCAARIHGLWFNYCVWNWLWKFSSSPSVQFLFIFN